MASFDNAPSKSGNTFGSYDISIQEIVRLCDTSLLRHLFKKLLDLYLAVRRQSKFTSETSTLRYIASIFQGLYSLLTTEINPFKLIASIIQQIYIHFKKSFSSVLRFDTLRSMFASYAWNATAQAHTSNDPTSPHLR